MKGKLANVIDDIKCIFEKKNLDITSLILKLRVVDDERLTIFSTDNAFVEVRSITELFNHIALHCSIYDYELLLSFVVSTNCKEAEKMLEDFTKSLHSSILEKLDLWCVEELCDSKTFNPETHKLVINYVGKEDTKMKTQRLVKSIIYERFNLPKASITFKGVEVGSVAFIYQISPAVKAHLLKNTSAAVFSEKDKIKYLAIDDEVIQVKGKCVNAFSNSIYTV